jgi:hypothetical protein
VIDLVFTIPDPDERFLPKIVHDLRGPLDHSPITLIVPIADTDTHIKHTVLLKNSEEEKEFLGTAALSIQLLHMKGLDSVARIEEVSQGISDAFSLAWQKCTKEVTITSHSKPWWNQECADAICQYWEDRSPRSGNLSAVLHARQRGCSLMLALRRSPKLICAHET